MEKIVLINKIIYTNGISGNVAETLTPKPENGIKMLLRKRRKNEDQRNRS